MDSKVHRRAGKGGKTACILNSLFETVITSCNILPALEVEIIRKMKNGNEILAESLKEQVTNFPIFHHNAAFFPPLVVYFALKYRF